MRSSPGVSPDENEPSFLFFSQACHLPYGTRSDYLPIDLKWSRHEKGVCSDLWLPDERLRYR